MNDYLKNITPDSFSGIIFALEGIKKSVTIINGPTGCRFYHAMTAENQTLKYRGYDQLDYPEKWFFWSSRVPCTSLESREYIYGSREKLTEVLEYLRDTVSYELLCVVNSPGAALIGDDLRGIIGQVIGDVPFIAIETPGFSSDICSGYEKAAIELIKQLGVSRTEAIREGSVNILGLSIFHRNCLGDIEELARLMELCGITVNCFLCSDCDTEDIRHLPEAALNIVIHPEYGLKTAEHLQQQFDTPFYICDGPPVGFSATEKMMREVCGILGKDESRFMIESKRARARAYAYIARFSSSTGLPGGVRFAVEAVIPNCTPMRIFLSATSV